MIKLKKHNGNYDTTYYRGEKEQIKKALKRLLEKINPKGIYNTFPPGDYKIVKKILSEIEDSATYLVIHDLDNKMHDEILLPKELISKLNNYWKNWKRV